jgi:hypothetical protein
MPDSISAGKITQLITPGAAMLEPRPAGILVTVAGSATFDYGGGITDTIAVLPVGEHVISPMRVTAAVATIHGLHDPLQFPEIPQE